MSGVRRLAAIRLVSRHPTHLAAFYVTALGFRRGAPDIAEGLAEVLTLGPSRIELIQADADAARYPADVPGWSPLFQHCAVITADMAVSYDRLRAVAGWRAITIDGPQRLPASSGGVTAFKFRDPEGHPLELLFAPGGETGSAGAEPNQRIGHSAISVADPARSIAFYQGLGFSIGERTFNRGPEQARLDGLVGARAEVVALNLPDGEPHVELLGYQGDFDRRGQVAGTNDVAATRLILTVSKPADLAGIKALEERNTTALSPKTLSLLDPDGHRLRIEVETRRG